MTTDLSAQAERELQQIDIDALWLACRLVINVDNAWGRHRQADAQLRLQRLVSAGIVDHGPGQYPTLKAKDHSHDG